MLSLRNRRGAFVLRKSELPSMENDLLSVIVPVYNAEKYVARCIESILASTYKNLELILVDDGSTDGSLRICETYRAQDDRVKVFHTENGGGVFRKKLRHRQNERTLLGVR